jgi:putative selenate reductase
VVRAYGLGLQALDTNFPDAELRARCAAALADGTPLAAAAGPQLWPRWVSAARLANTEHYVAGLARDPRYGAAKNSKPPRMIDSVLTLWDCITCDKCVPVCPNNANFTFALPPMDIPRTTLVPGGAPGFTVERGEPLHIEMKHQIGNFADFCNDCGNCDVFCPEVGGPYQVKPRFFGTFEDWRGMAHLDGFYLERTAQGDHVWCRHEGLELELVWEGPRATFSGPGFEIHFDSADPEGTAEGTATGPIDLVWYRIMERVRATMLDGGEVSYVSALCP